MLAHYEAGDPDHPMIVLVHGVCNAGVQWVDLIRHLSDRYFVIAFDSLGHGVSPRFPDGELDSPADSSALALEEALDYVERLHNKKPVVIAHSMGGAMSSKLSIRRPDLFAGLILEDPAWLSTEQAAGYRERAGEQIELGKKWRTNPAAALRGNMELRPHWDSQSHAAWIYAKTLVDPRLLAAGIVSFPEPWREVAQAISVPSVIVTSDTDEVLIGTSGIQAIAELGNPALRTEIIPNVGHAVSEDAPEEFCALVDKYLAQWLPNSPSR